MRALRSFGSPEVVGGDADGFEAEGRNGDDEIVGAGRVGQGVVDLGGHEPGSIVGSPPLRAARAPIALVSRSRDLDVVPPGTSRIDA